jgi:hypothetical protein
VAPSCPALALVCQSCPDALLLSGPATSPRPAAATYNPPAGLGLVSAQCNLFCMRANTADAVEPHAMSMSATGQDQPFRSAQLVRSTVPYSSRPMRAPWKQRERQGVSGRRGKMFGSEGLGGGERSQGAGEGQGVGEEGFGDGAWGLEGGAGASTHPNYNGLTNTCMCSVHFGFR